MAKGPPGEPVLVDDKFATEWSLETNAISLVIRGSLTEFLHPDKEMSTLAALIEGKPPGLPIRINLNGITRLNSAGVRAWMIFLAKIKKNHPFVFALLPESFVEAASATPFILGNPPVAVSAFNVPYLCLGCENRFMVVGRIEEVKDNMWQNPNSIVCPACKHTCDIDVLESEYFFFLKVVKKPDRK